MWQGPQDVQPARKESILINWELKTVSSVTMGHIVMYLRQWRVNTASQAFTRIQLDRIIVNHVKTGHSASKYDAIQYLPGMVKSFKFWLFFKAKNSVETVLIVHQVLMPIKQPHSSVIHVKLAHTSRTVDNTAVLIVRQEQTPAPREA